MSSLPPSAPGPAGSPCPHCGELHPVSYTHCPKTGKPLTSGRALIGRVIAGRYRVIGLIGEGGMGAVYVAEHTLIGRKVALKRLHPELARDEKAVQRFQREARAAAATGHEHIVDVLDLGYAEDGAPYLIMEYLPGQSLAALLRNEGKIAPRRACFIIGQVLAALGAVHAHQIVHRDLKPDNVLVTRRAGRTDYVKIVDFGISKMKQDEVQGLDLTRTGTMLGTPFYMSPEQARGVKHLDHRVDLYAAGVILYESITGRVPFQGDNYHQLLQAILRHEPERPSALVPGLDPGLEAVILKAIAKEPDQRFQSAAAMLEALVPFGAQPPALSDRPPVDAADGRSLPSADVPTRAVGEPTEALVPPNTEELRPIFPARGSMSTQRGQGEAPRGHSPASPPPQASTGARGPATTPSPDATAASPPHRHSPLSPTDNPATPSQQPGPRYFFASSDDWDEARAEALIEVAAKVPQAGGREPGSVGMFRVDREQELARESVSGAASVGNTLLSDPSAAGKPSAALAGQLAPGPPIVAGPNSSPLTPGTSEAGVKGSLVIAALDHIEATWGASALEAIRGLLDRESQKRLSGVVLPTAWLPLACYDHLLLAAERVVGGSGEGAVAVAIGRATAESDLSRTHRHFIQSATPSAAADRIPQVFRGYHSRGEARVFHLTGGGVRLELDAGAPESLAYAWAMGGFFQRMLELTGARDVRAAVMSYRARGDDKTALALRWR